MIDLTHIDGKILITGLGPQPLQAALLTRAEVLQLVRFAAELWPDQVLLRVPLERRSETVCRHCARPMGDHADDEYSNCGSVLAHGPCPKAGCTLHNGHAYECRPDGRSWRTNRANPPDPEGNA